MIKETIDLVFSFDTTGSMYPCITQVRRSVEQTVRFLFKEISNIRIGIIAHGDYCDGHNLIKSLDLSTNVEEICRFIRNAPRTGGGDDDECYELVLNHARSFKWTSGRNKALVLIGDCAPHSVGYSYGGRVNDLDWENEAGLLLESGIRLYPVQALGRFKYNWFYDRLAEMSDVEKINLPQFSDISDMIMAICFQRAGRISEFEETLRSGMGHRPSYHVINTLDDISLGKYTKPERKKKRKVKHATKLTGRFQILNVDSGDRIRIDGFVRDNGLTFNPGRGFYEYTKAESRIREPIEVMAVHKRTGEIISGTSARDLLGIPHGETRARKPSPHCDWTGYIQSTSYTRLLMPGSRFLYEVHDWR